MINEIIVDLSVAIPKATPEVHNISGASWIRVWSRDSAAWLRVGNGARLELSEEFSLESCRNGFTTLSVDNDNTAGAGELVIIWSDGAEKLSNFLGSGDSGNDWRTVALLLPDQTGFHNVVADDYNDAAQWGSTAGVASWERLVAGTYAQISCVRYGSIALGAAGEGYSIRTLQNIGALLDWLFSPTALTRDKTNVPSRRIEFTVAMDATVAGGNAASLGLGFINRVAGLEIYGVGFFVSNLVGGANFFAGVLDYSGGAAGDWPIAATRLVWQDTGQVADGFNGTLAIEVGQTNGDPYVSWEIDGIEVYRHDGVWPGAGFVNSTVEIGEGIKVNKNVAADSFACRVAQWAIKHRDA